MYFARIRRKITKPHMIDISSDVLWSFHVAFRSRSYFVGGFCTKQCFPLSGKAIVIIIKSFILISLTLSSKNSMCLSFITNFKYSHACKFHISTSLLQPMSYGWVPRPWTFHNDTLIERIFARSLPDSLLGMRSSLLANDQAWVWKLHHFGNDRFFS